MVYHGYLRFFFNREKRVCVIIVLVHFGPFPQEVNEKSVKLAVWAVSLNFLHDFTLFVVDIHQIRLISLFRHFPDHFHFHGSAGLIPKVNLSLRLIIYNINKKSHSSNTIAMTTNTTQISLNTTCTQSSAPTLHTTPSTHHWPHWWSPRPYWIAKLQISPPSIFNDPRA